jgi:hypothetical protein
MKFSIVKIFLASVILTVSNFSNADIIYLNNDQILEIHFQTEPDFFIEYDWFNLSLPLTIFSGAPLTPSVTAGLSINGNVLPTNTSPSFFYYGQSITFDWTTPSSLYTFGNPPTFDFEPLNVGPATGIFTLMLAEGELAINTDLVNLGLGLGTGPFSAVSPSNYVLTDFIIIEKENLVSAPASAALLLSWLLSLVFLKRNKMGRSTKK